MTCTRDFADGTVSPLCDKMCLLHGSNAGAAHPPHQVCHEAIGSAPAVPIFEVLDRIANERYVLQPRHTRGHAEVMCPSNTCAVWIANKPAAAQLQHTSLAAASESASRLLRMCVSSSAGRSLMCSCMARLIKPAQACAAMIAASNASAVTPRRMR